MKREMIYLLLCVYWLALLGSIVPALVSLDDTFAVLFGFALLIASAYSTYRFIRREIRRANNKGTNK